MLYPKLVLNMKFSLLTRLGHNQFFCKELKVKDINLKLSIKSSYLLVHRK